MSLTVSSSGDPHRDSCATLGEVNPPTRHSASPKTGMINANFMALAFLLVSFHPYRGVSVNFVERDTRLATARARSDIRMLSNVDIRTVRSSPHRLIR